MVKTYKVFSNISGLRDMTEEEKIQADLDTQEWNDTKPQRQLEEIREIRLRKLRETDYLANSDMVMSDEIKAYRQGMRDIPQNNTTEDEYDLILARDEDKNSITYGNLTNEIWSKPE